MSCFYKFLCFLLLFLYFSSLIYALPVKRRKHHYSEGDEVPFYVNKIGPYRNPTETYEFYSLPFCRPKEIQHKHHSIGEDISGDHKVSSLYDIRFRIPIKWVPLCKVHTTGDEVNQFIGAIKKYYYYEMNYDDLPLRGFVGTEKIINDVPHYFLFKHLHFHFLYNKDQVIFGNVTADPNRVVELIPDTELQIEFSYSAEWSETKHPFSQRMKLYEEDFFPKELEIHWLSILNSCVLVLLLTGFLAVIIIRILRNDYNRYRKAEEEEQEEDDQDYGWKLVHGDVFRFPSNKNLFCAFYGLGIQSLCMFFGILLLAVLGLFHPNNDGSLFTALIVLYALTSIIGGYTSCKLFTQMGGEKWAWNIILVASLYSVPVLLIFAYVNTVAIVYNVTAAVPFTTILLIFSIVSFVGIPLAIIGGIAGKRTAGSFEAPCRTKLLPREVPPIPWYRTLPVQMIMSGFLPFSAIYIELFYVFSSVWGHSSYQLFGILFLVAIILILVTAAITIALTYFQLSMEDHFWWWKSFLSGGSTGFFIYAYAIYFYFERSEMSGLLQGSFFFPYMGLVCYFFFLMLGSVGFYSSLIFVKQIYKNLKID